MAINNKPIFSGVPAIDWYGGTVLNSNTSIAYLVGSNIYEVFVANATYGSYVQKIRFKPISGTTQSTNNVASLARIWISDGYGIVATGDGYSHHILYDEISLPATTASATNSLTTIEVPLNIGLPPGYIIYTTLQTAVSAGYHVCTVGGHYTPQ